MQPHHTTPLQKMAIRGALLGIVFFFFACAPRAAWSQGLNTKACHALLKEAPQLAAECYVRIAKRITLTKSSSLIDRKQKALLLENAAKSYEQAASQTKNPDERAYLYEQSGVYLRQILTEKLCFKVYRCKSIQGLLYQVQQETGYNNVTLLNPLKNTAEVEIRGYRFEEKVQVTGRWTKALRPGTYTFRATYPGKASRTTQVTLEPRKDQLLYTSPVTPPIPTGAWLLGGFGAAVAAIGATALVVSFGAMRAAGYDGLQDIAASARKGELSETGYEKAVADLRRANNISSVIQPLQTIGVIAIAVGSAAALGALVWMFLPRKSTAGQSIAQSPRTNRSPFFVKSHKAQTANILYKTSHF
ncbi:MAG: hypothetical protein H6727_12140 [Myxococcales bacterium]|nr:hypothetical protein [Myxococcales bacterium]